jgi:hypothetical protein
MQNFMQIAAGLNMLPLQMALMRQQHLFGQRGQRGEHYVHAEMTDIWVRYNDPANIGPHFNDEHDSVWYPAYYALPELRSILFGLMAMVEGERLGGVLITKIPPGGKIAPHVDGGWHAGYYEKYFIPVQNDDGAVFGFEDGVIRPAVGDVYWFNNSNPHWVENHSSRDRIALIVCIRSHKFKGE